MNSRVLPRPVQDDRGQADQDCSAPGYKTAARRPLRVPYLAAGLALAIFVFDTLSPLQFSVAVLYVFVILLVATDQRPRRVPRFAVGCAALTVLSFLLEHGLEVTGTAPLRALMSLAANAVTTLLTLKIQRTSERLAEIERQRASFERFFPAHLIEHLMEIDASLTVARHQRAAVLFVDMIDSTSYIARMTPTEAMDMLRELLELLGTAVHAHNGTINKYLGDGLMAVFGSPRRGPLDATNAARCAVDIQRAVDRWNALSHRSAATAVRVAVGIHYGDVVQGDIGNDRHLEFTVVGHTVNIASRVETLCRSLGASVLATGAFIDALRTEGSADMAETFGDRGHHVVRGNIEPMRLYGVIRSAAPA